MPATTSYISLSVSQTNVNFDGRVLFLSIVSAKQIITCMPQRPVGERTKGMEAGWPVNQRGVHLNRNMMRFGRRNPVKLVPQFDGKTPILTEHFLFN